MPLWRSSNMRLIGFLSLQLQTLYIHSPVLVVRGIEASLVLKKKNMSIPHELFKAVEAHRKVLAAIEKSKKKRRTVSRRNTELNYVREWIDMAAVGSYVHVVPLGCCNFHKTGRHVYSCLCTSLQPSSKRQRKWKLRFLWTKPRRYLTSLRAPTSVLHFIIQGNWWREFDFFHF